LLTQVHLANSWAFEEDHKKDVYKFICFWYRVQLVTWCVGKYSTKFPIDTCLNYCLVLSS